MDEDSFWNLHSLLRPYLEKKRQEDKKKHRDGAKNGIIPTASWLSAALRYFAAGSPYNISVVHGMSHSEVFTSVWRVVDDVNGCSGLEFHYPSSHNEQRKIADGFWSESKPGFECCAGAIDGMLLWLEQPSEEECDLAHCGSQRFFCGRKCMQKAGFYSL
jgi:hypothetical protein